jgi:DNA-binding SARP family transcriptional activator
MSLAFRGIAAAVLLLAILVGVPLLLVWLVGGVPIPTSLPSRDVLTQPIGVEQLVTVLVVVTWLAWLQFLVCVLVELRSELSGVGLPRRVPFAGPSQRLARALVSSMLVLATIGGTAGAANAAVTMQPAVTRAPAVATVAHHATSAPAADAPASDGESRRHVVPKAVAHNDGGRKIYIVQPPRGRHHDSLWDIADRCLGDGRRYKEIFELNKGRLQPDGDALRRESLIRPGWVLYMPADAVNVEMLLPPASNEAAAGNRPGAADHATAGDHGAGPGADATRSGDLAGQAGQAGQESDAGPADRPASDQSGGALPRDILGASLLGAGVLAALAAARRARARVVRLMPPGGTAADAEVAVRVGAAPERAEFLDSALRDLAAELSSEGRRLLPVYCALVSDEALELRVAPPVAEPAGLWQVADEGRRWTLERSAIETPSPSRRSVLAPYPGLVGLGTDSDGRHVLVDIEAAQGAVSVSGDAAAAVETVTAMAAELAINVWSDHLRVTAVGLPRALAGLAPGRVRVVGSASEVLVELEARAEERRRLSGLDTDVLTGRLMPAGGEMWMPEYVVLGAPPEAAEAARLAALLLGPGRSPLGVIVAGELPVARWRLGVDAKGRLEAATLGVSVDAQRLSPGSLQMLATLMTTETERTPPPVSGSLHEAPLDGDRPPIPAAFTSTVLRAADEQVLDVRILGPIEVDAHGDLEPARATLATEMAVYLALHPEGVHPTVLAAAVWPRGVTAAVRESTFARVRTWLGVDAAGQSVLTTTPDGRLVLKSAARLDWAEFCSLLARSRRSQQSEIADLNRALALVRGPLLDGRPAGRYAWLARESVEYDAPTLIIDAAHRLAVRLLDRGDPESAAQAARAGLKGIDSELLWRDLMRAEFARDGRRGALAALDGLTALRADDRAGPDLEPETEALADELIPHRRLTSLQAL